MNVETIDKDKLKISLTLDEIISLFGSYENINYQNQYSKATLHILYQKAVANTDFPLDCQKLLIEVKPIYSGCEIYFTKLFEKENLTIKRNKTYALYFKNSEDLISFIKTCKTYISDLLQYQNNYILKIYCDNFDELLAREYCHQITTDLIAISHITEHATLLCKFNAIKQLKSAFKEI